MKTGRYNTVALCSEIFEEVEGALDGRLSSDLFHLTFGCIESAQLLET
jgi:hypothetical protein